MSRVDPSLPLDYILKVIGIDTEVGRLGKVLHEVKTSGGKDVGEAYAEILEALEGVVRRNGKLVGFQTVRTEADYVVM